MLYIILPILLFGFTMFLTQEKKPFVMAAMLLFSVKTPKNIMAWMIKAVNKAKVMCACKYL